MRLLTTLTGMALLCSGCGQEPAARNEGPSDSFPQEKAVAHQETLKSEQAEGRAAIVQAFTEEEPEAAQAAVAVLEEALWREEVRIEAIRALSEFGSAAKAAIPALEKILEHRDPRDHRPFYEGADRFFAALALADMGSAAEVAVPTLEKALKDDARWETLHGDRDFRPRPFAVTLPSMEPARRPWSTPALRKMIKDCGVGGPMHLEVRLAAAYALGEIGPAAREAMPALRQVVQSEEDYSVRRAAASTLGKIGPAALPTLMDILKAGDSATRRLAIYALGKVGPEAIPILMDVLEDGDLEDGDSAALLPAIHALEKMGPTGKDAIPLLHRLFRERRRQKGKNTDARKETSEWHDLAGAIIRALGEMGPDAIPVLKEALEDEVNDVAARAASALGEIGPPAVPVLYEAIKGERPAVREKAILALGEIGPAARETVPALVKLLNTKDCPSRCRACAAGTLGKMGPAAETTIPALLQIVKDSGYPTYESEDVCLAAVNALGEMGPAAVPALRECLKNDMWLVRVVAAHALAKIDHRATETTIAVLETEIKRRMSPFGDRRGRAALSLSRIGISAISVLQDALKDADEEARLLAAYALGKIGPEAKMAIPKLQHALNDEETSVRHQAAWAMGEIGQAAIPALEAALKDKNSPARHYAAGALGNMGPAAESAVPTLAKALVDEDRQVRAHAAQALGKIGPGAEVVIPVLWQALKDEDDNVRYFAACALGQIGPAAIPLCANLSETTAS